MKLNYFHAAILLLMFTLSNHVFAQTVTRPTITTTEIMADTTAAMTALSCVDYRVVGACIWLTYDWPAEWGISTTVKVGHYIPDVVVSSYAQTQQNPWSDIQPVLSAFTAASSGLYGSILGGFPLGGGNAINRDSNEADTGRIRFKNVDVVGHPMLSAFGASDYRCSTVATMLEPYFVSDVDVLAWRFGIPESAYPQALNPFSRNIKNNRSTWGSVYPRAGALLQNHDYKAGAVMAERAGDVVTRNNQPHIYTSIAADEGDQEGQHRWPPSALIEGDVNTGHWQMLLPNKETGCYVFADIDDTTATLLDPNQPRINPFGDYVWNLWRPYSCCSKPNDAVALITSTGSYP